uniref:Uncharacterized protein n=1 Tax=Arundo donax TaxID=35708 RepID=A0A0A8ZHD7_ARUDO
MPIMLMLIQVFMRTLKWTVLSQKSTTHIFLQGPVHKSTKSS